VLRFAADEHVDGDAVREIVRRNPTIDIVRIQDIMPGAHDRRVLEWAAEQGRVLITYDKRTMAVFDYEHVAAGLPMPGVYIVRQRVRPGRLIEELLTIADCTADGELEGQVCYLPL
jgi:hypothetical protein